MRIIFSIDFLESEREEGSGLEREISVRKMHQLVSPVWVPTGARDKTCNPDMCPQSGIESTILWCLGPML